MQPNNALERTVNHRIVMRHHDVPDELSDALEAVAAEQGWSVGYDTHFDASNAEMSKWFGPVLHRLDFQPLPGKGISVTHLTDRYAIFPRACRWARRIIPMFPHLAKTQWSPLGEMEFGQPLSSYVEKVRAYVHGAA
jgi:hypothetical protein